MPVLLEMTLQKTMIGANQVGCFENNCFYHLQRSVEEARKFRMVAWISAINFRLRLQIFTEKRSTHKRGTSSMFQIKQRNPCETQFSNFLYCFTVPENHLQG